MPSIRTTNKRRRARVRNVCRSARSRLAVPADTHPRVIHWIPDPARTADAVAEWPVIPPEYLTAVADEEQKR